MAQIGGLSYDAFKMGSRDIGHMGTMQTDLTTIELGFAPFVPLSQLYYQETLNSQVDVPINVPKGVRGGKLQASPVAFKFMPHEGKPDNNWLSQLKAWEDANYSLQETVNNAPDAMGAAARLSKAITEILEGTTIESSYTTTVKGELEEQALLGLLLEEMGPGQRGYSETLDTRHKQINQRTNALSPETFDLVSQNDVEQDALEYTLQSLARALGDEDFVRDVRGLETTTMVKDKMFVGLARDAHDTVQLTKQEFATGVQEGIDLIEQTILEQSSNLELAYKALDDLNLPSKVKGVVRGSYDSENYMGKQVADRVYRLMHDWAFQGTDPKSFIFQVPINKDTVGYVSIWGLGTPENFEGLDFDLRFAPTTPPEGLNGLKIITLLFQNPQDRLLCTITFYY